MFNGPIINFFCWISIYIRITCHLCVMFFVVLNTIYFLLWCYRFNEDCGFTCCNYREHQTHFHCMRKDCNYRFCDKTRFVQHTARHERLDTLCGKEFEGFRGVSCGRESCELNINYIKGKKTENFWTTFRAV